MKQKLLLFIPFLICVLGASAQIGGNSIYKFMNLPTSARVAALGGQTAGLVDDDVALMFQNPAALNPEMHNQLTFNTAIYFAGINFGYVGFGRHIEKTNTTFGAGIQYIAYGKFEGTDPQGYLTSEFSAGEYALNLTASRSYKRLRYGGHLKAIYSSLESYNSFGLALDLGGAYVDTASNFTAGVVVKNIGAQLSTYTPDNREPIPFEIQAGIYKRMARAPFGFHILAHNLQQPDIRYNDPNVVRQPDLFGDTSQVQKEQNYIFDKIAYHFILGTEIYLGKNLRLRAGYNHMRRQNLSIETRRGLAGFSFGGGLKISYFQLNYAMARYHLAGSSHHISLTTNLNDFFPSL